MATATETTKSTRLAALHDRMAEASLNGHWQARDRLAPLQPRLWPWADIHECLIESGEVVALGEDTGRRTVQLTNPALTGPKATSRTLQMSVQLVKPGETAEAHRHSMAALRFVVQGRGAFTTVNGERFLMAPGDLVLTPNWTWHNHANFTDEPIIWLDVLDLHLTNYLSAAFFETYNEHQQPITKPDGYSRVLNGLARPLVSRGANLEGFNYVWSDTARALETLAETDDSNPHDGVILEYTNPLSGGPTLPTIGCSIQRLRPGEVTQPHRHTSTTIFHVVRGKGHTIADGQEMQWSERDCFIVPPWQWHEHRNASATEPATLFSVSDRPVAEALGLYREEAR